jgi:cytochrome c oxidase subunit 3
MKRSELQSDLAMMVTLISGAMLFLTLFMGYAVYRSSAEAWPPVGMNKIPMTLPLLSTLLIVVSSWFAYQTKIKASQNNFKAARKRLHLTLVLGFGFMLSQAFLWKSLKGLGIYTSSGIFASVMYGFTWIHAAHVAIGLLALVYLRFKVHGQPQDVMRVVSNVEKFWHFLGVIWIVMLFGLFVF